MKGSPVNMSDPNVRLWTVRYLLLLSIAVQASLGHLFQAGPHPPEPGPGTCGEDPRGDELERCEYGPAGC